MIKWLHHWITNQFKTPPVTAYHAHPLIMPSGNRSPLFGHGAPRCIVGCVKLYNLARCRNTSTSSGMTPFLLSTKKVSLSYSKDSVGRCSSPSTRPWACRWRTINICDAWDARLRLPSQPPGITARWPIPNYTARWQRHMCVNNLPMVALDSGEARIWTRDMLIASPAS